MIAHIVSVRGTVLPAFVIASRRAIGVAAAALVGTGIASAAAPDRPSARPASQASSDFIAPVTGVVPLDLSAATLRRAVEQSRDPADDTTSATRATFGSVGGGAHGIATPRATVDRAFRDAEIPSCLASDALTFDVPTFGPIGFGGTLALPFWADAIASGRCRR